MDKILITKELRDRAIALIFQSVAKVGEGLNVIKELQQAPEQEDNKTHKINVGKE